MIWIRADANKKIGTGHVMRCLSVAKALQQRGEQVCFLVADTNAVQLLESHGQAYRILNSDYMNPETEVPQLKRMYLTDNPRIVLVDSYFATPDYIRGMREFVPVGYMDDTGRTDLSVDILINYNIFAKKALYCNQDIHTKYLLGLQYVPLREEFREIEYKVKEKAERVLLTTGGSDKYNLAGLLLRSALENKETAELRYSVVSGIYNPYSDDLLQIAKRHKNVEIHCNVSNMSELMQESDIAVSAGGSTLYELAAVGVPMICFSFVDNQERIVEGFCEQQLVCYGGNYLLQKESMITEVVEHMAKLAGDNELREIYSRRQRAIVDGQGAARIAGELMKL